MLTHRLATLPHILSIIFLATSAAVAFPGSASASHEIGTYGIYSPLAVNQVVTSPPRYHSGGSCPYWLYDSPDFDNPSTCTSAVSPTAADWSFDIDATDNDAVYIDISPEALDGYSAGGTYRVVAGAIVDWRPNENCANDKYQYFGVHVKNGQTWENYACG